MDIATLLVGQLYPCDWANIEYHVEATWMDLRSVSPRIPPVLSCVGRACDPFAAAAAAVAAVAVALARTFVCVGRKDSWR